jgi:hypothetical protein
LNWEEIDKLPKVMMNPNSRLQVEGRQIHGGEAEEEYLVAMQEKGRRRGRGGPSVVITIGESKSPHNRP